MTGVPCEQIDVLDLRVGDRVVVVFSHSDNMELTEEQATDILLGNFEMPGSQRVALKSVPVKEIDECPGQWRTHVHVNKRECYDQRGKIWVTK